MKKKETIKKWVNTWKKAEPALDAIKTGELRREDYYSRNRALLNNMLQYAFDNHKVRRMSGLVEQQRILKIFSQRSDNP